MPKVSVIIATHSRPQLLPRAVQSAFDAGTDVEVIVVDDASTDETAQVCQTLPGIKYIRVERNQHTAGARNIGIVASTAPYISFLDDDDWRLPKILDEQVKILNADDRIALVYGRYLLADQSGNIINEPPVPAVCPQGDIFWQILKLNPIGCLTAVFRKSCLFQVGLLDQTIPGTDDLDLWIRIAELHPFAAVEQPVAVWRSPTADSGQGSSNFVKLMSQVMKNFDNKWSNLPRALADKEKFLEIRNQFISNLMDQFLYEAAHTISVKESLRKFYRAIIARPDYSYRSYTYKVLFRSLLNRI